MSRLIVVLALVLFLAVTSSVHAAGLAGIPIAGADISYTAYNPIGSGESLMLPTLTLRPYTDVGPATPGKLEELLPWAKSNLGIEVPFEGDATTLLRPRGIGISEAIQVGSAGGVPVRAGIAWVSGAGTCLFVRAAVLSL